jgi:uncharacterized SAM-binding protein YcdF (DUF218 family)
VKGLLKLAAALLIVAGVWAAGLLAFVGRVQRSTPAPEPAVADAIVSLTGGSNMRLEAATRLLEDGKGQRLLVSGVNREATRADIRGVTRAGKSLYDCCVDLGFTAADTIGNARETAEWARGKDYDDLIVVTADYHMPRALLELRAAMPEAAFHPYPVATGALDARHWTESRSGQRRMVTEYSKYLAILGREGLRKLGFKMEPAERPVPPTAAEKAGAVSR